MPRIGVVVAAVLSALVADSLDISVVEAQGNSEPVVIANLGSATLLGGAPEGLPSITTGGFRDSQLPLAWMVVVDSTLGVVPSGLSGAQPDIKAKTPALKLSLQVRGTKDVVAIEVTFLTFDIWNRFTGVYRAGRVLDFKPGQKRGLTLFWYGMEYSDLRLFQTTLLYISRVRLANGTVIVADRSIVLGMAKKIESSFKEQSLDEPKPDEEAPDATAS